MPEINIKEVRLPELHLPEIKRDEIVRALSGIRLPQVDLAMARKANAKLPALAITSSDVGKLVAATAAVARIIRPAPSRGRRLADLFGRRSTSPVARLVRPRTRRSRLPLAIGVIVVMALAVWALLRRPAVRTRVDEAARQARERFEALRTGAVVEDPPVGIETASIESEDVDPGTDDAATDSAEAGIPVLEESRSPG